MLPPLALALLPLAVAQSSSLPAATPPRVQLFHGVSNVPTAPDDGTVEWPPPAPLSHIIKPLADGDGSAQGCQAACLRYRNTAVSPVSGWTRCQSFTYTNGSCYARLDAAWAPRGVAGATSGRVSWPAQRCGSVRDCSHNGVCSATSSLCECFPAWRGDRCQTLDLLPAVRGSGLRAVDGGANTSTWGGSVARADDGSFHMLASEMTQHCGINAWASNSHVVHAVSSTPGGAYSRVSPHAEAFPVFSHEPNLARAPTGEFVVYFTAHDPSNHSVPPGCACTNGTSSVACGNQPFLGSTPTYMSWSKPSGPGGSGGPSTWSPPVQLFKSQQSEINMDTNFAAVILANGSVVGLGRTGTAANGIAIHLVTAKHWREPSSYRGRWTESLFDLRMVPNAGLEDPFVWLDGRDGGGGPGGGGIFHAVFHNQIEGDDERLAGGHAWSEDGLTWVFSGTSWNNTVRRHPRTQAYTPTPTCCCRTRVES
jgi:hypothetical protein